jgi:hypothetical protein
LSPGFATTTEATALVRRTARHFAHKVPVRDDGTTTKIDTRFGACALRPSPTGIEITLDAADADSELRLQKVIQSHLERFARAPLNVDWRDERASEANS